MDRGNDYSISNRRGSCSRSDVRLEDGRRGRQEDSKNMEVCIVFIKFLALYADM